VHRVEESCDAQGGASEQFASALEQFRATVNFDVGDLGNTYDRLNAEYENSVAEDLLSEWVQELDQYSRADLRRTTVSLLNDTRTRDKQLMTSMRCAERSIAPVLEVFQDQVLVLKHNLNARTIGARRVRNM